MSKGHYENPDIFAAEHAAGRQEMRDLINGIAEWVKAHQDEPGDPEKAAADIGCAEEDAEWALGVVDDVQKSATQRGFLMAPYDYETDMRVKREEAREDGRMMTYLIACALNEKNKEESVAALEKVFDFPPKRIADFVAERWDEAVAEAEAGKDDDCFE